MLAYLRVYKNYKGFVFGKKSSFIMYLLRVLYSPFPILLRDFDRSRHPRNKISNFIVQLLMNFHLILMLG